MAIGSAAKAGDPSNASDADMSSTFRQATPRTLMKIPPGKGIARLEKPRRVQGGRHLGDCF
jgi:hypothetical protein